MPITGASEQLPGQFYDNGGAWVHVEHPDYAYAVGLTNHSPVIQAALDTGKHVRFTKDRAYNIGTVLTVKTTGQLVHLNGATLTTTGSLISAFSIGNNGFGGFVKTDDVEIRSGFITGLADGTGSAQPPYAIGVLGPATVPYTEGIGCSRVRATNVRASGFCYGVMATGADDLRVTKCRLGGMKYYAALGAGGYGVLAQTCFNVRIERNSFTATATDRHAVYISADPNRTFDNNNICKDVVIGHNRIDWRAVNGVGPTGFEAPIELRSPENCTVRGNVIRGGYGGIDYDAENGNGSGLVISGNVFDGQVSGASSRACVSVTRSSGSYLTRRVAITGNTFNPSGALVDCVALGFVSDVAISGNVGAITNTKCVSIVGSVTGLVTGGNTWNNTGGYTYFVAGTGNSGFTFNRDQGTISGGGVLYNFTTTPTNLRFGFVRTATLNATSSGTPTIGFDEFGIIASVANHANGLSVTLSGAVEGASIVRVLTRSASPGVAATVVSAIAGQVATLDARNTAGTVLPGASNTYTLVVEVTS